MARRILELLKSLLIFVLILNILLLSLVALPTSVLQRLSLPKFLREFVGLPTVPTTVLVEDDALGTVSIPYMVSVHQDGARANIRRDSTALSVAYDKFSRFFSMALSTAMEETSVSNWDFLRQEGVMLAYSGNLPAQVLSQWLGHTDGKVSGNYSHYALVCQGEDVLLYTVAGSSVKSYLTSVHSGELLAQMREYLPDGSQFAYDVGERRTAPLTLMEDSLSLPEYTAVSPLTDTLSNDLAVLLGFNAYGAGTYTDPNGNRVYTEGQRSLVVSTKGITLNLPEGNDSFSASGTQPSDFVSAAGKLLDALCSTAGTNAPLYLTDFSQENDVTTCTFCYSLGGVPVFPAAATAQFTKGSLTELSVTLQVFHRTGSFLALMPQHSAFTIAENGKLLLPAYHLNSPIFTVGWQQK